MNGKAKCKILKEIRRQIAEKNDIAWVVEECSHKGNCKGTCPKCEAEVRMLERELELRRKFGKAVAVTGISAACMAGLTACSPQDIIEFGDTIIDGIKDRLTPGNINEPIELDGDVDYIPDDLSGYIENYPSNDPDPSDIEIVEGEVPFEYYQD